MLAEVVLLSCHEPHIINPSLPVQMCVIADRWQAPSCLQLALAALAAVAASTLTATHVGAILTALPSSLHTMPAYDQLKAKCATRLVQLFGDVPHVITDRELRHSFFALPPPTVLLWAGQDQLSVDSENSVVVLLMIWYIGQPEGSCSPEFLRDLAACVRVQRLTHSFRLGMLPQFEWFGHDRELVAMNIALATQPGHADFSARISQHFPSG